MKVKTDLMKPVVEFKEKPVGEPYSISNPPALIKNLPKGAQRAFISTFNAVLRKTGDEDQARMAGWASVKRNYKKSGNKWIRK